MNKGNENLVSTRPSTNTNPNTGISKLSDEGITILAATDLAPDPEVFGAYIAWACVRLQLMVRVKVVKMYINEYISVSEKTKSKKPKSTNYLSRNDMSTIQEASLSIKLNQSLLDPGYEYLTVYTIFDYNENFVQLKFGTEIDIDRLLLKVIGLIIPYQTYLTSLTINKGINNASLYELSKFLPSSNITDICLDNTNIPDPNYYLLLENESKLRNLSLARCKIDDDAIMKIALKLSYPLPASKTLSILNLPTNRITDAGAKCLAVSLRSNRKLAYLNLADNAICDDGSLDILHVLTEFPLNVDEITASKSRYVAYIRHKRKVLSEMMINMKTGEVEKKIQKKKMLRPSRTMSISTGRKSTLVEKEEEFSDPFSSEEIYTKDGIVYCYGNNHLAYINLSYNDVSYITVKKLLAVLETQKTLDRQPRGLINLSLDGNYIPENCIELLQIDEILDRYLTSYCNRRQSAGRKKVHTARSGKL